MLANWTPENNAEINRADMDLITSPVLMGDGVIAQTGKDNVIRLLDLKTIEGTAAHTGRELQTVTGPRHFWAAGSPRGPTRIAS
jgi:hypothetical protein